VDTGGQPSKKRLKYIKYYLASYPTGLGKGADQRKGKKLSGKEKGGESRK